MKAIRKIIKSGDDLLGIRLPSDFRNRELELIILPVKKNNIGLDREAQKDYQAFILNLPQMNEQQYTEWESEKNTLYSWLGK